MRSLTSRRARRARTLRMKTKGRRGRERRGTTRRGTGRDRTSRVRMRKSPERMRGPLMTAVTLCAAGLEPRRLAL